MNLEISKIVSIIISILYLICIIVIAKEDKKSRKINKKALASGIILAVIYIIYACIIEKTYKYAIHLAIITILLAIDSIILKKKAESNYIINILMIITIITIFTGKCVSILTIAGTLIAIALMITISAIKNRKNLQHRKYYQEISIGFVAITVNIIMMILSLIYSGIYLT